MARDYGNEMNYQEAVRESYRAFTKKEFPGSLTELLDAQMEANELTAASSDFE